MTSKSLELPLMPTVSTGRGVKRSVKEPTKKQLQDWIAASGQKVICVIQHPSGHVRGFYYKPWPPGAYTITTDTALSDCKTLYCFMLESNTLHRPVIYDLLVQLRSDYKRAKLLSGKIPAELTKKEKRK